MGMLEMRKVMSPEMMKKLKEGKLPLKEIENVLENFNEEDDLQIIERVLNENLAEWARLLEAADADYEPPARITLEQIEKIYDSRPWPEATRLVIQIYGDEKEKLMRAFARELGLDPDTVEEIR